jgi:5-bromo-4-chloroindolyl phosphate hydrolysis protein
LKKKNRSELASLIMLNLVFIVVFGFLDQKELFFIAMIQAGLCTALRAFLNDSKNNN